ncbi:hypothetical protein L484_005410 [Morus notabilis]|uniref:Uncharacterized protein n=1 Tax=Morus notabilis TaxID=981085 RepID=W9S3Q7_9ROSA|nr:hypothetical protein L484_005410 [Morus notabilis]
MVVVARARRELATESRFAREHGWTCDKVFWQGDSLRVMAVVDRNRGRRIAGSRWLVTTFSGKVHRQDYWVWLYEEV